MKLRTNLTSEYVPDWGLWEAIREAVQNGIDGQEEFGYKLDIRLTNGGKLIIKNAEGSLPRDALLMGYSTKRNKENLRGDKGEGLKLSALVLIRNGYKIIIRNQDEIWVPSLEYLEGFSTPVLTFNIRKSQNPTNDLRVEISSIKKEDWQSFKTKFLFLNNINEEEIIETYEGNLLLKESLAGKFFVKGIYVCFIPGFIYGYDLKDADLDRDRRLLDSYDSHQKAAWILRVAIRKKESLVPIVYEMLEKGISDAETIGRDCYLGNENPFYDMFVQKYGENAFPVTSEAEVEELKFIGGKGIIVSKALKSALASKAGSFEEYMNKISKETFIPINRDSLDTEEWINLDMASDMLLSVESNYDPLSVIVCEYATDNILGQYINKTIRLNRSILKDLPQVLETLVHEYSHEYGKDGEVSHERKCTNILSRIAVTAIQKEKV